MGPKINAIRLGLVRGWIEFQVYYLRDLQGLVGTMVLAFLMVGVLWFERAANVGGVSLALVTLPGLLAMLIANEGFSDVARFLSAHREDGTLLRAKAIPQGMLSYLLARVVVTILATIFSLTLVVVPGLFIIPGGAAFDGGRLFTFIWVLLLGLLATAPLGAVIGAVVKNSGAGFELTFFPLVILVAISGIFYPLRALPVWVQWIAQAFPVYWIGLGLRSVFSPTAAALELGGSFRPLSTFLVLAAWAVVGLLLAPRTLRRMVRRTSGGEMEAERRRFMR